MSSLTTKDDKEAAINAKIAAIRAANEARERRHREVEADRREAEKTKSAVNIKSLDDEAEDFEDGRFRNPYEASGKVTKKPERPMATTPPKNATNEPVRRGRGRLADDDGPPPDPGYSFLADRMRDGSPVEEGESPQRKEQRNVGSKRDVKNTAKKETSSNGPKSRMGGGSGFDRRERDRQPFQDENVSPKHRSARNRIEDRVGQNIRDIREEVSKSTIRPLMPEGFMPTNKSNNAPKAGISSAQSRLDRTRQQQNGSENFPTEAWTCPDPSCNFSNRPRVMRCSNCGLEWSSSRPNANRKVIETGKKQITVKVQFDRSDEPQHEPQPEPQVLQPLQQPQVQIQQQPQLVASTPSWTPTQQTDNQWQPMPINQWAEQPQPQQPQQMVIGHWENPHPQQISWQPIQDWSQPAPEATMDQDSSWIQHYPHGQFVHIPYQDATNPNPMMIPIGAPPHQEYHQYHHHPQAITQITHATQHPMPIMATQQFVPKSSETTYYNNGRPYMKPASKPVTTSSWHSRSNPDKEVTRIPPRFQKQRPLVQPQTSNSEKKPEATASNAHLPRASSSICPKSAKRLTIFGTSNVVNNLSESDLAEVLNIPVRLIPAMKLVEFKEKIAMVDPELDRIVLIHGLGNDARNLALRTNLSDVDKGAESDGVANQFADIVLDLIARIPYIKVLISTLLPRFDSEELNNMSNPNNVRKVMNVEISMRLSDKPNVEFINNDTVLEWWKDDVKKMRLFRQDGYHLSAYGFSMMLEHWMKTLKTTVSDLDLSDDSTSPETEFPPAKSPVLASPKVSEEETKAEEETENGPSSTGEEVEPPSSEMEQLAVDEEEKSSEETTPALPPATSDEEEFHEASESPAPKETTQDDNEFKEKENEEKMEKEL